MTNQTFQKSFIKTDKILELFSGNGSFSKVARQYGIETFTIDINSKFNPDLVKDVTELEKEDMSFNPSIIWSSPPCQEYSHAKRRGIRNIEGANKNVLKTLEIISWFPNAFWFIENPQTGILKNQTFMKDLYFKDVSYCKYGMPYRKQTRIWTNFKLWNPKNICKKDCDFIKDGKHICSVGNARKKYTMLHYSKEDKYHVPQELCSEILESIIVFRKSQKQDWKKLREELK